MDIKVEQAHLGSELSRISQGRGRTVTDEINERRAEIKSEVERLNAGR